MLADVLLLRGRGRRNLLEPAAGGAGSPRLRPGAVEPLPAKDAMPPAAPNGRPARSPPPPFTSAAGAHAAAGPAAPRCAGWPGPRRGDDLLLFPPSPPPPHTLPVCVQPARLAAAAAAPPLFSSLPFPPLLPRRRRARLGPRSAQRSGRETGNPHRRRLGERGRAGPRPAPSAAAAATATSSARRRAGPRAAHGKWAAGPRARSSARAAPTHGRAQFLWSTQACVCIYTHTPHRLSAWAVFRRGCPCRRDCVYYMFVKAIEWA